MSPPAVSVSRSIPAPLCTANHLSPLEISTYCFNPRHDLSRVWHPGPGNFAPFLMVPIPVPEWSRKKVSVPVPGKNGPRKMYRYRSHKKWSQKKVPLPGPEKIYYISLQLAMDSCVKQKYAWKTQHMLYLGSWDAIEPGLVSEWVSQWHCWTDLTDVTLVSEDTYWRLYW